MTVKTYVPPRGGVRSRTPQARFGVDLKIPLLALNPAAVELLETGGARQCIIQYDDEEHAIHFNPVEPGSDLNGSHLINIRKIYNLTSLCRVFEIDMATLPNGPAVTTVNGTGLIVSTVNAVMPEDAPRKKK